MYFSIDQSCLLFILTCSMMICRCLMSIGYTIDE